MKYNKRITSFINKFQVKKLTSAKKMKIKKNAERMK